MQINIHGIHDIQIKAKNRLTVLFIKNRMNQKCKKRMQQTNKTFKEVN